MAGPGMAVRSEEAGLFWDFGTVEMNLPRQSPTLGRNCWGQNLKLPRKGNREGPKTVGMKNRIRSSLKI